ncbi:MAG: chemotaxis protein CheW [Chloroflexota bacterium]|nr:chemotaxis protein CheW [Chloroflexota bacterium]
MNNEYVPRARLVTGQQYVIFRLGETQFGVAISHVLRIARLAPIIRVPRAPHFLKGVINHHGQVVPVVDLKKRLALDSGDDYGDTARFLIVELEAQPIGMLVDAVVRISRLPDEFIEPPPEMIAQVNGVYLTGVAHHEYEKEKHLTVLLDLSQVLTVEEVAEMETWRAENDA